MRIACSLDCCDVEWVIWLYKAATLDCSRAPGDGTTFSAVGSRERAYGRLRVTIRALLRPTNAELVPVNGEPAHGLRDLASRAAMPRAPAPFAEPPFDPPQARTLKP